MTRHLTIRAALLTGTLACLGSTAGAQSAGSTYADIDAGLGYSTNPNLAFGPNVGSGFGRISARGVHAWRTERSSSSVSGFVENSTYFRKYGNTQIFSVSGATDYRASESLRLFGNVGFSGDLGGQLQSRFAAVPNTPVVIDPQVPPLLTVVDPQLVSLLGRQYRVNGQVGGSTRLNARDFLSVSAGVQKVWFTGANQANNFNTYSGSLAFERQLSERKSIGARMSVQRADYRSGGRSTSFGPEIYGRLQFSEAWSATGSIGANFTNQRSLRFGNSNSTSLSFSGSLCRTGPTDSLCAQLSRNSQNAATGDLLQTTSGGVSYSRKLSNLDSIQFSLNASRYSGAQFLNQSSASTFLSGAASYNRRINGRLYGGINAVARQVAQFGPDPKADLGANVFLRYRLGDMQ